MATPFQKKNQKKASNDEISLKRLFLALSC
ncbi:hypothetical protein EAF56_04440 [Vibrio alginolyticus]|uniref:Uncharacterized protein n=1 Tax=Vibrio alginolyticus TaxID=663 RepID=A0ABX4X6U0_VIBAL|nr:hypothetical protein AL545_00225 [Vibrio alginolyticus]EGR1295264.1 hypothetical protein [Vibrio alginolyticus]PNP19902.1 hypothetical protein AL553_019870 [Vibrio alginolyticus]